MTTDNQLVKAYAATIRKAMRQGPRAMRRAGIASPQLPFGRGGVGMGRNAFAPLDLRAANPRDFRRLFRRAMKKAAQPFRRQPRGRLRAKAAGKNNIRGRR